MAIQDFRRSRLKPWIEVILFPVTLSTHFNRGCGGEAAEWLDPGKGKLRCFAKIHLHSLNMLQVLPSKFKNEKSEVKEIIGCWRRRLTDIFLQTAVSFLNCTFKALTQLCLAIGTISQRGSTDSSSSSFPCTEGVHSCFFGSNPMYFEGEKGGKKGGESQEPCQFRK